MGLYSEPSVTPAPDYAAANKAGIEADAATLPFRLQISQAAANGNVYTDPSTGQVYDFRGQFDPVRFEKDHPGASADFAAAQAKGEMQGWTPEDYAKSLVGGNDTALNPYRTGSQDYRNQTDINSATQLAQAGADIQNQSVRQQMQTYLEMLPQYNQLNLQQQKDAVQAAIDLMPATGAAQRAQDAATFNQNLQLGLQGTRAQADLQAQLLPQVNQLSLQQQRAAYDASQAASQTAFHGNLTQADLAAQRAAQLQATVLPGLNDLNIQLQTNSYRGADAAGRSVNPNLYAVRDNFAAQLADELKSGGDLTAAQRNRVQQQIRGAQAARGNILGDGAAFDEAIAESDYAQNMIDKRRQAALGLINSRDLSPSFSSVGVTNPTQVVAPNLQGANFTATTAVNPLMPNFSSPTAPNLTATTAAMPSASPVQVQRTDPLAYLNPNAGNNAANYGLSAWQTTTNQQNQQQNPWMQGLGMVAGAGLGAFSGGLGSAAASALTRPAAPCWIARRVLGEDGPQWRLFRQWLFAEAPASFRTRYITQGARFAAWLENKPGIIAILRPWFEARAAQMEGAR